MISDYYVNLHFNQAIAQRTGYAFKVGDKGCTFHFHCEDLDPSGMYPHIVFNHPNNTCVEGVPTGSGRDYAYTIQGNEFAVIGKTVVDLKFYDSLDATQRISTASFIIEILPDTYTPFEEASSSYADSLERAREEIDAAIIDLQGAEHDLEEAETDLGNMSEQFADTLQDYIDAFGNTGPINPRGEYDPNEPYVPRDAVQYTAGGKTLTYINRSACTGIAPTDPDHGAQYWQIMIDVAVGGALSALEDVSIDPQTLADGQMLTYNNTDDVWENKTILENSLTSTATDKALTAAKGKELQDNKVNKSDIVDTLVSTDTDKPLSANQGRVIADNLAANENVYGAKNKINGASATPLNASNSGGLITNTLADSRNYIDLYFMMYNESTLLTSVQLDPSITAVGDYSYNVTIPNGTTHIVIKHNGALVDSGADYALVDSGACILSLTVLGTDPSTIGGMSFNNVMLRDARIIDPTFAPYAETNLQLTRKTSGLSNENLLDNPWFTVNQRGFTTTSFVTGNVYTVDRWLCIGSSNGGSVTLTANGLQLDRENEALTGYLSQFLEKITLGKPYTLSIMLADGTIVHKSGILATTSDEIHFNFLSDAGQARVYYYSGGSTWTVDILVFAGKSFTVRAIKLEVGSVSTLANDVEPNYTAELLKCQRYFYRMTQSVVTAQMAWVMGHNATNAYGNIKTPVPMVSTPTLSFVGTFDLSDATNTYPVTNMSLTTYGGDTGTLLAQASGGSITAGKMYILACGSSNAYIDLSANL